MKAQQRL